MEQTIEYKSQPILNPPSTSQSNDRIVLHQKQLMFSPLNTPQTSTTTKSHTNNTAIKGHLCKGRKASVPSYEDPLNIVNKQNQKNKKKNMSIVGVGVPHESNSDDSCDELNIEHTPSMSTQHFISSTPKEFDSPNFDPENDYSSDSDHVLSPTIFDDHDTVNWSIENELPNITSLLIDSPIDIKKEKSELTARCTSLTRNIEDTRNICIKQISLSTFHTLYTYFKECSLNDDDDHSSTHNQFIMKHIDIRDMDVINKIYQLIYLETELYKAKQQLKQLEQQQI
jgi:hypothetical protein